MINLGQPGDCFSTYFCKPKSLTVRMGRIFVGQTWRWNSGSFVLCHCQRQRVDEFWEFVNFLSDCYCVYSYFAFTGWTCAWPILQHSCSKHTLSWKVLPFVTKGDEWWHDFHPFGTEQPALNSQNLLTLWGGSTATARPREEAFESWTSAGFKMCQFQSYKMVQWLMARMIWGYPMLENLHAEWPRSWD